MSFVVKGAGAVILLFRLEYKTSVVCHNVNTQKGKIARRDRPHILASNRFETFENLLHNDITPLRRTLSGILQSKNLTMIFIGIRGPWLCQNKCTWLLCTGPRYGLVQYMFSTGRMCKFNRALYSTQLIQFARIPAEFVVRFISYQYRVKEIYIFHSCLVSTFNMSVQYQSSMLRVVHSMHFR